MMTLYILDTDHISLVQRGHPQVTARIAATQPEQLSISIVTAQEQMRGRLAQVQHASDTTALIRAYKLLHEAITFHHTISIVDFDKQAVAILDRIWQRKIRISTLDLRIAAIALAAGATLVTRNRRDFERAPGLVIEDWSVPM